MTTVSESSEKRFEAPRSRSPYSDTRVLILCQLFYPELVSTGQTLTELAEQLVASEVDVEVLCGPPTILGTSGRVPKRMEYKGIRIRRVWGARFPKLSLLGRTINQVTFTVSAFLHLLFRKPTKLDMPALDNLGAAEIDFLASLID